MQVPILLTFILLYSSTLLDAAEIRQDKLKSLCQELIKGNESLEECKQYLNNPQRAIRHLEEIIQKFIDDKLSLKSVKDFYTRVIEKQTYKCTGYCVLYLMRCMPLNEVNDWESVLQFADWEYLWSIGDNSDTMDGSLCRNILNISRKPENKKVLEVLKERNIKLKNKCRADFQIIAEIADLCDRTVLYDDKEFKGLFIVDIINGMCDKEDKWEFEAFKTVVSQTFATDQTTRNKFVIVLEMVRNLKNKTSKYINETFPQILELLPPQNLFDVVAMHKIIDTFNYLKVNPGRGLVKRFFGSIENNPYVMYGIVRCIYEVEASTPYPRVNWDTYFKFNVLADFFIEENAPFSSSQTSAPDVCEVLVHDWNVSTWRILFDVLLASVKVGFNTYKAWHFYKYVPVDFLLYKDNTPGVNVIKPEHLKHIQLISHILLQGIRANSTWRSLSERNLIAEEFINLHFQSPENSSKAMQIFFSKGFQRIQDYKSCPISVVVEILKEYDRPCSGKLDEEVVVDLVNIRWNQRKSEEQNPEEVQSNVLLRTLSYVNLKQILKKYNTKNRRPTKFEELFKNYDTYAQTILVRKLYIECCPHFLESFLEEANHTGLDQFTILNLAFREDNAYVSQIFQVMNNTTWSNLGPSIVKLSDLELKQLPILLCVFKYNSIPVGKWLKSEVAQWLEFVQRHGSCLGAEVLNSNQSLEIHKIIQIISEKEEAEIRDLLCTEKEFKLHNEDNSKDEK